MAMVKPTKKKKMSKPALIASIIAIVIVLALVASLLFVNGFFFRIQKGASSNNFEVNASMMEYFSNSYVENWYSNNYYYILLGYVSFDPNTPYNQQYTDSSKTQTFYDFFVQGTKLTVETYLKYCEAAMEDPNVDFGKLNSEAEQYAKDTISALKEASKKESDAYYKQNGMVIGFNEYLQSNFGAHVSEDDLKKCLVIEHIASSYYELVHDRYFDGITEEREDKYFEENIASYVSAKYLIYTLNSTKTVVWPKAEDYVGGKDSAAYKAKIQGMTAENAAKVKFEDYEGGEESVAYKADYETAEKNKKANEESLAKDKALIEKLAAATTAEEFKSILLNEKYSSALDNAFSTATSKFDPKEKPSTALLDEFKATLKEVIIEAVLNEEDIDEETLKELIKDDQVNFDYLMDRYGDHFESAYNTAVKDFAAEDKLSKEDLDALKAALKQAIIDAVIGGKEDLEDKTIIVLPSTTTEKMKEVANNLPKTVIASLKDGATDWIAVAKVLHTSTITNLKKIISDATRTSSYTLTSQLGQKLFGGVKGQYGIAYEENEDENGTNAPVDSHWMWDVLEMNVYNAKLAQTIAEGAIAELEEEIAKETDAEKKTALEEEKKKLEESLETAKSNVTKAEEKLNNVEKTSEYSLSAYFVTKAAYRDETKVRDVGHILFKVDASKNTDPAVSYKTSEEAKAAAEELLAKLNAETDLTKEKFEEYASVTHDSNVFYENVTKDQMVEEFEDWLFKATTVGEVGLVETTYGWHIMYYGGESGEIAWRIDAHEKATDEEVNDWYEDLPDYGISFNDDIFLQIFEDRIQ